MKNWIFRIIGFFIVVFLMFVLEIVGFLVINEIFEIQIIPNGLLFFLLPIITGVRFAMLDPQLGPMSSHVKESVVKHFWRATPLARFIVVAPILWILFVGAYVILFDPYPDGMYSEEYAHMLKFMLVPPILLISVFLSYTKLINPPQKNKALVEAIGDETLRKVEYMNSGVKQLKHSTKELSEVQVESSLKENSEVQVESSMKEASEAQVESSTTEVNESKAIKKRGVLLNLFLVLSFGGSAVAGFAYWFGGVEIIMQAYPKMTIPIVYFLGIMCVLLLFVTFGVWNWRKWGVYGFYVCSLIGFGINVYLDIDIVSLLKSLISAVILYFATKDRLEDFS